MVIPESCPAYGVTRYKKNGHTRHGKQNPFCKNCERQFSADAENLLISAPRRTDIEHLLRERLSLCGICRAVPRFDSCEGSRNGMASVYTILTCHDPGIQEERQRLCEAHEIEVFCDSIPAMESLNKEDRT